MQGVAQASGPTDAEWAPHVLWLLTLWVRLLLWLWMLWARLAVAVVLAARYRHATVLLRNPVARLCLCRHSHTRGDVVGWELHSARLQRVRGVRQCRSGGQFRCSVRGRSIRLLTGLISHGLLVLPWPRPGWSQLSCIRYYYYYYYSS